jgi:hypothetical protein
MPRPDQADLPRTAAWRHLGAWDGFEVLFVERDGDGYRFAGHAATVEEGVAWSVRYSIVVDGGWATRTARVRARSAAGKRELLLEGDGSGAWLVDGRSAPELAGYVDVDLEASAFTNAFPVHRLGLAVGERADAPAVYVRAPALEVERLEQRYTRLPDDGDRRRYDYESPAFGYRDVLVYDDRGLVVDYPGIAERVEVGR